MTINHSTWLEVTDNFIDIQSGAAQLFDLLCQAGEHPDVLLRKTRLFKKDFSIVGKHISPQQLAQLYYNATLSKGHDALAFKLGQRILPTALGTFSNGLIHSPDLKRSLNYLADSCFIWSPLLSLDIKHHDEQLHISFIDKFGLLKDQTLKQFVITYSFSAIQSMFTWLAGEDALTDWTFDIRPCDQQTTLEFCTWMPSQINLNQAFFAITIPEYRLNNSFNKASPSLFNLDKQRLNELTNNNHSLLDILRLEMSNNIQIISTVNQIAEALSISTTTLKRKLKKHQTTYQNIVDHVRAREMHFLQQKLRLSENDIAKKLNFYDVSNLRRAQRRWATS
jgi:AraC-like DNA-binding protein